MKQMDKLYERINWENEPSVSSPLNATNLNRIDYAVEELDNRVISLDTTKISKAETASDIVDVSLDEDTGIFTFTRRDGATVQLDTKLEKIVVNFEYDYETECLVLIYDDGTKLEIDVSKLITIYEFLDSDTIAFSVNGAGKVTAIVKNGSITETHLQPNYLADIKVESAKAVSASQSASASATASSASAQESKTYANQSDASRDEAEESATNAYASASNAKTSEDKAKVSETNAKVSETNAKISEENAQRVAESLPEDYTELSKAFYNTAIKQKAVGDNIHVTDSAEARNVEFGLYGKATQDGEATPDNRKEITVSGSDGSVRVVSAGEDLIPYPYYNESLKRYGIDFTVEKGAIIADGKATALSELVVRNRTETQNPLILNAGTYTLRGCPKGGSRYGYKNSIGKSSQNNSWETIGEDYGDGFTFTIDKETQVGISCSISSGITVNNLVFKPMLYDAAKETISDIPTPDGLAGIKVSSGGNYTDENGQQWICDEVVKYADGSGKRIQRIKKIVLNGSEKWTASSAIGANGFYSSNAISDGVITTTPMLCDSFVSTTSNGASMLDNQIRHSTNNTGTSVYLYLKTSKAETVDELKAFLAENNATCYYILAEPIITDLSAEEIAEIEKLHTFYPITNISNDSDCGMAVTYLADMKNYIDNKLATIESALVKNI